MGPRVDDVFDPALAGPVLPDARAGVRRPHGRALEVAQSIPRVVVGHIQLGLSAAGVDWAELRSITVTDVLYADIAQDCLDMVVDVRIRQNVTAAA